MKRLFSNKKCLLLNSLTTTAKNNAIDYAEQFPKNPLTQIIKFREELIQQQPKYASQAKIPQ